MGSSPGHSLISFFLALLFSSSALFCAVVSAPLLAQTTKDAKTLLYTTTVALKTPPTPTKLLLDLGASFSWNNCERKYNSTTYDHVPCNSSLCFSLHSLACVNCYSPPSPSCANDTCSLFPENSVSHRVLLSTAIIDVLSLPTLALSARNPCPPATLPRFLFSCARDTLLKGLPKGGVSGFLALGRSNFSLPAQVAASTQHLLYLFALCLSGSPSAPGVVFFGTPGPYYFLPDTDASINLTYTPLLINPVGGTIITYYEHPSDEYFVGVTGLRVNGKSVPVNASLLAINESSGFGGTKLSTVTPYTVMETSIYRAFVGAFVSESEALNLTVSKSVKPFDVCFSAEEEMGRSTREGPAVPSIDLVLHSDVVVWRMFGANSMVVMEEGATLCLGFVDGGKNPRTSIVIGGHQMEDNLVQFDVERNRVGFSGSLLDRKTTCSNFNFTASSYTNHVL